MTTQRVPILIAFVFALASAAFAQCTDADGDDYFFQPACGTTQDCNDADPNTHPAAVEMCDGLDNDCDRHLDNSSTCDTTCDTPELFNNRRALVSSGADPFVLEQAPLVLPRPGGYLVIWLDGRNGDTHLYVAPLDPNGAKLGEDQLLSDTLHPVFLLASAVWTGVEYGFVWTSYPDELWFSRVDALGRKIGQDRLIMRPDLPLVFDQSLAWDGSHYAVVWSSRVLNDLFQVFFARFDSEGVQLGPSIQLTHANGDALVSSIVWSGSSFAVTWSEAVDGFPGILLTTLDSTGQRIVPDTLVAGTTGLVPELSSPLRLLWTGSGYSLSWASISGAVQITRLDEAANVLGTTTPIANGVQSGNHFLSWTGTEFGFTWNEVVAGTRKLRFSRVDANGVAINDVLELAPGLPSNSALYPASLLWDGEGYALAYATSIGSFQVFFARLGCNCPDGDGDGNTGCSDCNDSDPSVHFGASELCNDVDDDCDGRIDDGFDQDGDEITTCQGDCDDARASVFPGAPQLCDGLSNDCRDPSWPVAPANEADADGDGFHICEGDCNDGDPGVHPGALEVSNGVDDNCNGRIDEAPGPEFVWAKQFVLTNGGLPEAVAVDSGGSVYTVGYFGGTADFDPGPGTFNLISLNHPNAFISKLDIAGNFVWAKHLSGLSQSFAGGVAVDGWGNVYSVGLFDGTMDFDPGPGVYNLTAASPAFVDGFISKLDSAGNFVWAIQLGGSEGDAVDDVTVDSSGNVYLVGEFSSTVDFDPGPGTYSLTAAGSTDAFIAKIDSAGTFSWAMHMGGTSYDAAKGVAVDASGSAYAVGYFRGTADFDPGPGTNDFISAGSLDAFITKFDSAGNIVWAKQLGGNLADSSGSVGLDAEGNVYLAGVFSSTVDFDPGPGTYSLTSAGSTDAFISKLDGEGTFAWATQMGGTGGDGAYAIAVDTTRNVFTVGTFSDTADFDPGPDTYNLTSAGGNDGFISKLDSDGNLVWAIRLGGTGYDYADGVAVDASGNLCIVGPFNDTVDFDPGLDVYNLTSTDASDGFVLKLEGCGNPAVSYRDADDDGFGSPVDGVSTCTVPPGYVATTGDCNDENPTIHPSAPEVCNGVDDDCNGQIDEGFDVSVPCMVGIGVCARAGVKICTPDEAGTVCNVTPGPPTTWYRDQDGDGYGDPAVNTEACAPPLGYASDDTDCNDTNPAVHPGGSEVCNAVDDNCNGQVDEDAQGVDSDGDSIHNACDNCRFAYNPSQLDPDADGIGSACDNCALVSNASQADLDLDGRGNACDNCPTEYNPFQDNSDADGLGDACDNCALDYNPDQRDVDHDSAGDRCDLDDGVILILFADPNYIEWQEEAGFTSWNVYEGDLDVLKGTGVYTQAPGSNSLAERHCGETVPYVEDFDHPPAGKTMFSLVTGVANGVEGSLGQDSRGVERPNANPCP